MPEQATGEHGGRDRDRRGGGGRERADRDHGDGDRPHERRRAFPPGLAQDGIDERGSFAVMSTAWPELSYVAWSSTCDTLQGRTQVLPAQAGDGARAARAPVGDVLATVTLDPP